MVFLDAASGEPMDPAARAAYLAALDDGWADADRLYREGRRARMLLDAAREAVAEVLGARPDETVFTSSGTAALHTAVAGIARGRARVGGRIVTSAVEHSAVLHAAQFTAGQLGGTHETIGVDRLGRIDIEALGAAVDRGAVALACVQSANHETGTVQPLDRVWDLCDRAGVMLLVDAAASLGRLPVPGGWSALCGSARKWGGPAGVGVLAVRKGTRFAAGWPEDERESGRAPGPVNVPAVLAAAAALRARQAESREVAERQRELVALIRDRVAASVPDVEVVGDPVGRLPHVVTFSCLYASGEALLTELDRAGFSVSSGSSCTASTLTPSHVLEAMGVLSHGNVRVSLPWEVTRAQVELFLDALPGVVAAVRAQAPADGGPRPGADAPAAAGPNAGAADLAGTQDADEPDPHVVDALGRLCPIPVIELAGRIGRVAVGETVTVLADDTAARLDIPAWCEMRGHTFLGTRPIPGRAAPAAGYLVRRDH